MSAVPPENAPPSPVDGQPAPAPGDNSNTAPKQRRGVPFVKGDKRINRKGRPKGFDEVRAMALKIAKSKTLPNGKPVSSSSLKTTAIEAGLWEMAMKQPEKFIRVAYGDPPPNSPIPTLASLIHQLPPDSTARLAKGEPLDVVLADLLVQLLAEREKRPGTAVE